MTSSSSQSGTVRPMDVQSTLARILAFLPIPAFVITTVVLTALNITKVYEPRFLMPAINGIVFIGASILAASLAGRGFLVSGAQTVLMLGGGMLTLSLACLIGSTLVSLRHLDAGVSAHNIGALLAGIFHLTSGVGLGVIQYKPVRNESRTVALIGLYTFSVVLMAIVTALAWYELLPEFVTEAGTTPVRSAIMALTVAAYLFSAVLFYSHERRSGTPFLRWYWLGLCLIGIGMAGVVLGKVGSPVSWTGRASQSLGQIYMLISLVAVLRAPHQSDANIGFRIGASFRQIELEYRTILQGASEGVVISDAQGVAIFANRRFGEILCRHPEQIVGQKMQSLFASRDREENWGKLNRFFNHENLENLEISLMQSDGSKRWVLINSSIIGDSRGRPNSVLIMVSDITERKQAEEALRLMQTSIDDAAEMVAWFTPDGKIRYANDATCRTLGYSRDELMTLTALDFSPGFTWEQYGEHWQEVRQRKSFTLEVSHRRKDGSEYPAEVLVNHIEYGGQEYIFAYGRDITERKQAEVALKEGERLKSELLAKLNEAQRIGIIGSWDWNLRTDHVWWSEETYHIFGVTPETFTPSFESNGKFIHPDDFAQYRSVFKNSLQTGEPLDFDCRLVLGDGTLKHCNAKGRLMTDDAGQPLHFVGTIMDITERKQLEEELRKSKSELELRVLERTAELRRSNQALQDFTSIASHDMNEPLRKVISFGNMLKQKHKDSLGETGNDYLNRMIDASQRMQVLLTSLLEYSKVTMNSEPFTEADLYDIVHGVLSDLEIRIQQSGGQVDVGKLPTIEADPTQMRQLFQNLIGNALKFHKDGEKPIVKVSSTVTDNDFCQIVVEDNGIGFDEHFRETIFAPFKRLCGKSQYEGTGMGLAICKKIIERHGGSIMAKNTPGGGSTFIIRLPLKQTRLETSHGAGHRS